MFIPFAILVLCAIRNETVATAIELITHLSGHNVEGTIRFEQLDAENETDSNPLIRIHVRLASRSDLADDQWQWFVMEQPVDYVESLSINDRCKDLGSTVISLDQDFSTLQIPANKTIDTRDLRIFRDKGLFGKSVILRSMTSAEKQICGTITTREAEQQTVARAVFRYPISGHVYFRWMQTNRMQSDVHILAELYDRQSKNGHVSDALRTMSFTNYRWKIYASDILRKGDAVAETNCDRLQTVYDPLNENNNRTVGDLDNRLGLLPIRNRKSARNVVDDRKKFVFVDGKLSWTGTELSGRLRRHLYLAVFDARHPDTIMACAQIRTVEGRYAKAVLDSGGIRGNVDFGQRSRFEPTAVTFNLTTTVRNDYERQEIFRANVGAFKVHELPIAATRTLLQPDNVCFSTNNVFNANAAVTDADGEVLARHDSSNEQDFKSQDAYRTGDLSAKLAFQNFERNQSELDGHYWDLYLPLEGKSSIVHRAFVIYRKTQQNAPATTAITPWICGNINLYEKNLQQQTEMRMAEVRFYYPLAGRVFMRQDKRDPFADTSILFESVMHSSGDRVNDSSDHRWAVHDRAPDSLDFYAWQRRCETSGPVWNPFALDSNAVRDCDDRRPFLCAAGDLTARHDALTIVADKERNLLRARRLFIDGNLPLSGPASAIGRGFVIYDDYFQVKNRGTRLACSKIRPVHRRKAVAKDWRGNGEQITLKGRIEFVQQSIYDLTNVEVHLMNVNRNATSYAIHETPVDVSLEFPCESSALHDHWNPLRVDKKSSPKDYRGTSDQYELGDLSGKYGLLPHDSTIAAHFYNDSMMPLFGPRSILGRSIVLSGKKNRRWACSSIERGYSPNESREIRKIASFHHVNGLLYGYIRMKQLIGNDGSESDTIIEVNLKYNRQPDKVTKNHNWAIFTSQVNPNAVHSEQLTAHCIAAGVIWNPYFTQLAAFQDKELYRKECGSDEPERCMLGDLGSKIGLLDLNANRTILIDANLPLEGSYANVSHKSLLIYDANQSEEKLACANIEPDYDFVKDVNVQWSSRFVLSEFINNIREIMNVPEWMLTVDNSRTSQPNRLCVQLSVHFRGPIAHQLEQDFNRLLENGHLDRPSLDTGTRLSATTSDHTANNRRSKLLFKQCKNNEVFRQRTTSATTTINQPNSQPLSIRTIANLVCLIVTIVPVFFPIII